MSTATTSTFQPPPPPALWSLQSARFHIMLMLGCITMMLGMIHGSISMVMICMSVVVKASRQAVNDPSTSVASTIRQIMHKVSTSEMSWTIDQQALVHAGFYLGSVLVLFPSHLLIKRYRAKRILTCGLFLCGVGSLLTPLMALSNSHWLLSSVRVMIGIGNGLCVPCGFAVVAKWFPKAERDTALLMLALGNHMGILCSMAFTPIFCKIQLLGGWLMASELYGITTLALLVVWELRAAHKPRHSNYVTASELEYIRGKRLKRSNFHNVSRQLPLKQFFLSPSVLAISLCCFTHWFIISSLIAYLPLFNQRFLRMDLQQNGISSATPFFFQVLTELSFHFTRIFMQQRAISTTAIIKLFASIATCGAASCLLSTALLESGARIATTVFITLAVGMLSGYSVGYRICATTIAPQFTRIVLSYLYACSQLAGVVSPILIAALISQGIERKLLLSLLVVLLLSTGITFLIFAHGRREVYVDFYGDTTRISTRHTEGGKHLHEEEDQPAAVLQSSTAVTYHGGEVNVPLRQTDSSHDAFEDELTSDDEF